MRHKMLHIKQYKYMLYLGFFSINKAAVNKNLGKLYYVLLNSLEIRLNAIFFFHYILKFFLKGQSSAVLDDFQ